MTLLVNEIHIIHDLRNSYIIFAADSRITTVEGKHDSNRQKIFSIDYLNAGVGYFGLAQMNSRVFISEWLPTFISKSNSTRILEEFARLLCDVLNEKVDKTFLKSQPSGFHICGYNDKDYPEFWFIRNHIFDNGEYKNIRDRYTVDEQFLALHAKEIGYDGANPEIDESRIHIQYYVNGDVRSFHGVWKSLDDVYKLMFTFPHFRMPTTKEGNEELIKLKIDFICKFHEKFASQKIVGKPIDIFTLESPKLFVNLQKK